MGWGWMIPKLCHSSLSSMLNMTLVEIYSTWQLAKYLIKNVGSAVYGEQQLFIIFSYVYIIPMPPMTNDAREIKPLIALHATKTKGQDFKRTIEVYFHDFC
jgi:hypothetical protein